MHSVFYLFIGIGTRKVKSQYAGGILLPPVQKLVATLIFARPTQGQKCKRVPSGVLWNVHLTDRSARVDISDLSVVKYIPEEGVKPVTDMELAAKLPEVLLAWYQQNKRQLPWRQDKDPYHIWVSEIMLQQTRVEAVKPYYRRFMEAFPSVARLANADDERLYKLWEGLGYYSRVRNLKKAAVEILQAHDGKFPRDHKTVLSLPGIGPYTAGAICSIAFDLPTPAVDGNVLRVMARLLNDATPVNEPAARKRAEKLLSRVYPACAGDFTQALMELGATVCGPNHAPQCALCPCNGFCRAKEKGTAQTLPVKKAKSAKKEEHLTVLILSCDGKYALEKRPDKGLLAGLWQFPNLPGTLEIPQIIEEMEKKGVSMKEIIRQVERSHIFTHIKWVMRGVYMEVKACAPGYSWFTAGEISRDAALPTAFRQFWEEELTAKMSY